MCLITSDKIMYTAAEDIRVYKDFYWLTFNNDPETVVCSHDCRTILYQCTFGIEYYNQRVRSNKWKPFDCRAEDWLRHNCSDWEVKSPAGDADRKALLCIEGGFFVYDSLERALIDTVGPYFECIIPKGSTYYQDKTGIIVSDRLIVKGFVYKEDLQAAELIVWGRVRGLERSYYPSDPSRQSVRIGARRRM